MDVCPQAPNDKVTALNEIKHNSRQITSKQRKLYCFFRLKFFCNKAMLSLNFFEKLTQNTKVKFIVNCFLNVSRKGLERFHCLVNFEQT